MRSRPSSTGIARECFHVAECVAHSGGGGVVFVVLLLLMLLEVD